MQSIYIEHNFLSEIECAACVQFYKIYKEHSFYYECNHTKPLDLYEHREEFDFINERVVSLAQRLGQEKEVYISNHEIVQWIPKSKMGLHHDLPRDKWSVILYLNDDYFGGKTIFENGLEVKAKAGTIVVFNGSAIQHGVTEVLNGERYTMAYWIRNVR